MRPRKCLDRRGGDCGGALVVGARPRGSRDRRLRSRLTSRFEPAVEQRVDDAAQGRDVAPPLRREDPRRPFFDPAHDRRARLVRRRSALQQEVGRFCCMRSAGLLVERVLDHLRVDPAEVGDAGARPERRQLGPQRAAQRLDPGLGDRVGAVEDAVDEGVDGGDDDDVAAPLDDLRQRRPHRAPDAEQVDLEDALPLLGRRSRARSPPRPGRCRRWRRRRRGRRSARPSRRPRPSSPRGR